MSELLVSYFGATDIGRVRTNNEDTFIARTVWDDRHILLAAIDGMGGEEGGEVAAEIARTTIIKYIDEFQNDTDLNLIKRAVADANNEIVRHKEVQPQYRRMGCVATAGILDLDKQTLSIAHVGDSRLYRFSRGELAKLTHDHSLVGYQEEQGFLTEEQAMKHPRRSVIERCLGSDNRSADDKSFIEAGVFPLIAGETFVFCSDGLCDVLTSVQISECLHGDLSPEEECRLLIDRANEAGGKDNITVVVVKIEEIASNSDDTDKTDTQTVTASDKEKDNDNAAGKQNRKPNHQLKWIIGAIIVLCCCTTIGFFIGKRFSTQEPYSATGTTPNIGGTTVEKGFVPTVKNDTVTTIESTSHE